MGKFHNAFAKLLRGPPPEKLYQSWYNMQFSQSYMHSLTAAAVASDQVNLFYY